MKILICAGNRANDELLSTKACNEMHGISRVNEQNMRYDNNIKLYKLWDLVNIFGKKVLIISPYQKFFYLA